MKEIVFEWQPQADEEGNISTAPPIVGLSQVGTIKARVVEIQHSEVVELADGALACRAIARLHPTLPEKMPEVVEISPELLNVMNVLGRTIDPTVHPARESVKLLYSEGKPRESALTATERYLRGPK